MMSLKLAANESQRVPDRGLEICPFRNSPPSRYLSAAKNDRSAEMCCLFDQHCIELPLESRGELRTWERARVGLTTGVQNKG